jgi:hypothetical protein
LVEKPWIGAYGAGVKVMVGVNWGVGVTTAMPVAVGITPPALTIAQIFSFSFNIWLTI